MDRRKFLKLLGAGAAVTSSAFYGCRPEPENSFRQPVGRNTYGQNDLSYGILLPETKFRFWVTGACASRRLKRKEKRAETR